MKRSPLKPISAKRLKLFKEGKATIELKKSPLKKKAKKYTSSYFRKECVKLAKIIAKKRDSWKCLYCGRTKAEGWQIHGSHILPEGTYVYMSADPENIIALCSRCHVGGVWKNSKEPSWHEDPIYFAKWFEEKWPGKYEALRAKNSTIKSVNWEEKLKELKKCVA